MFETLVFATLRILYMHKQLEVVLHDPFKLIKGDCKDFKLLQIFTFQLNTFFWIFNLAKILKKGHCFYKYVKQHSCF